MRSLYEIGADLEALDGLLIDSDGEVGEGEASAALEKWFDDLGEERDEKIRRYYCALIAVKEANSEACEAESRRLARTAAAEKNGAKRLKDRLKLFFEARGLKKLDLGIFKPNVRVNGGVAPLKFPEDWDRDPASAPEAFHKVEIALNTSSIRELVTAFYAEAERRTAAAVDEQERRKLFAAWLESDDSARSDFELIRECKIGERGTHLRIR